MPNKYVNAVCAHIPILYCTLTNVKEHLYEVRHKQVYLSTLYEFHIRNIRKEVRERKMCILVAGKENYCQQYPRVYEMNGICNENLRS